MDISCHEQHTGRWSNISITLDCVRLANFTAKNMSSFHCVIILAKAHVTPSTWLHMSLYTVIMGWRVTVCRDDLHRVQYRHALELFMMYLRMFQSSCLWSVASCHCILGAWATYEWFLVINRIVQVTALLNLSLTSHPLLAVLRFVLWIFNSQLTLFDSLVSV